MKKAEKLHVVKQEIERFLEKEADLVKAVEESKYEYGGQIFECSCPKESGALRRASMDLTRALAEFRKP